MVMDVTPTPQCVGREFVRQYYTLLNKAPTHVHRFYNNNSSFVHGGLEVFNREGKPAVGQKQIHQCIQQLNFRDCHAKITQVDSQATLGNGVVVQVTGELSNGGQPMRRFTQTFVLGAQSPKQYYVHNDIFRYQDLVFGDEETETESHHYEADDEESELPPQPEIIQVQAVEQQAQFYATAPPMPTVNGAAPHTDEQSAPPAQLLPQSSPPPAATTPTFEMISQQHPACGYQSEECEPEPEEEFVVEEVPEDKPADDYNTVTEQDPPTTDNISPNEPKTYASTLVKSGGGVSNFNTSPNTTSKSPPSPPPAMTRLENRNNEMNMTGGRGGIRSQRGMPNNMRGMGRGDMNRPPMSRPPVDDNRDYGYRDEQGLEGERRRPINNHSYPDEQQLFLGNLPLSASENDLREVFKEYGTIVDLKIMSKSSTLKGQNGTKVPNYGFIVFDSVQTVQNVLSSRPIFFPGDNSVKLNVEEKKTKPRVDSGGRGGSRSAPMGNTRGSLSRGGQRGGFARGVGGNRPGFSQPSFSQRGGPR